MTPRQFHFLMERYELHLKREDRRAGEVLAMIYNTNRDSSVDPKGVEWWDFFPVWKEEPEEQSDDEMFKLMQLFTAKTNEGLNH